uniref:Uncharacterized protein AlNc14C78G5154 n=1 Tax=Albugo laibachii Nc14 TaxID=890382 RepID=F0WEV5_9STRA|nr:conserved hypothetical protein [Albugo laibachii Nc14]|eukprot:CCA19737.1 conserved hypothetical protein [Albugo laibachii Nc14]
MLSDKKTLLHRATRIDSWNEPTFLCKVTNNLSFSFPFEMVNLRLKRFSSRANDKHLRDGDFRTNPQVASVVHRNEDDSMYDGIEKEWRDCVSEDGNAKVEVSPEAVLHRASELDKCAGYGYKAFSSNPKSRFKDIPFRRHKDFFKCPQLSHATKAMLVRKANDTANVLIRDSIEPDPISSIIWKYHSTVDGIQLFRGYDRGHGRSIMMPISKSVPRTEDMNTSDDERSGIACNSGARDRYITCIRGVTEVSASLEEFAMLFKMDTRKQCSDNSMLFNGDLLDTETLYPLVQPSGEHPRRLVAIKWSAVQSPSKLFRNRDFCYLECQKEFHDGKGRKGWVRSFHSVRMSCCPSFEKEHGVVRGSLYRCGLIAIESETKPGVLDTTYTVEIDLKGRVPEKIIRSFLCHRIASVGTVDKLLQRQRLSTSPLLGDLEIPAKQIRPTCHLCYRLFSKIFGAKRFICRRCGEAACANCCDYWVLDIPVIGTKRVCICTYCAAEARTNHIVPLSSRGKARVLYTPRRLAAYEHMGSANKFTDDTISDTRERGDSYSQQPVLPVQCVPDARTRAESDCRAHKAPLQQQTHEKKDDETIHKAEALLQKHYSENAVERLNSNSSIPQPVLEKKPLFTMQQTEFADRRGMPERARSEIIKHNTIPFYNDSKHQSLKKNVSVNDQAIRERERAGSQAELTNNCLGNSSVGNGSSSTKRQSVDTLSSSHTNPSSDICVADSHSNNLYKRTGRSEIFEFVEGDNGEWIAKEDVRKQSQADSNQRNPEPPKEASSTGKRLSQLLSQEQKTKQSDGLEIASSYDSESLVDSNTDADDCPGCGTKIQQIIHDGIALDICFCPNNRPPVLSVEDMQHSRVHTSKEAPIQYNRYARKSLLEELTFEI